MSFKTKGDGGRELRLSFIRGERAVQLGKNAGKMKPYIECHILTGQPNSKELTLLGQGVASCSFQDPFDPELGRQEALHRAIDAARGSEKISQAERAAIYTLYFTRPHKRKFAYTPIGRGVKRGPYKPREERKSIQDTVLKIPGGLTLPPEGWQPKGKEA